MAWFDITLSSTTSFTWAGDHAKLYSDNYHKISVVFQEASWVQKKQGRVLSPDVVSAVLHMAFRN